MLAFFIMAWSLSAAGGEISTGLTHEVFPAGFHLSYGNPALVRLSVIPPAEVRQVPLAAQAGALYGSLPFGPLGDVALLLTRVEELELEQVALYLDLNANGNFLDDGPPWVEPIQDHEGRLLLVYPHLVLSVPKPYFHPAVARKERDTNLVMPQHRYGGSLRLSVKDEVGMPGVGSFFLRSWVRGKAVIEGREHDLIVVDDDSNGCFTFNDRWALQASMEDVFRFPSPIRFKDAKRVITLKNGTTWRLGRIESDGSAACLIPAAPEPPAPRIPVDEPPASPLRLTAGGSVPWMDSFGDAVQRARREGKPILLLLTRRDCAFCHAYLKQTFHDASVVELSGFYVPLHYENADPAVEQLVKLSGYPCLLVLDPKLKILKRISGFRTAPKLVEDLESAIRLYTERTRSLKALEKE
jgi:hypothetical protein